MRYKFWIIFVFIISIVLISSEIRGAEKIEVPVLMYHTFDVEGKFNSINTTPDRFEEQIKKLKEEGYSTITLEQFVNYVNGNAGLPKNPIMITIDDGYESVYTEAYPIIKKYNINATVFPIGSDVESGERFDLPMMDWGQMKEMYDEGLVEIQSHTYDLHWRLNNEAGKEALVYPYTKDGKKMSESQLKNNIMTDLKKAKATIESNIGNKGVTRWPISFS
ncbi:polysaccharide deacetylase family protein [Cytobacillus sp. Hm23]